MVRKWTTLALAVIGVTTVASGLAFASFDSPLEALMEKVGKENAAIKKATRTKVTYAKADKKEIVKNAEELIELAKKSREIKDAAEKQKKPYAEWTKAIDDFIKKTEDFKETMGKPGVTHEQAKKAFTPVTASCNSCHVVFKPESD